MNYCSLEYMGKYFLKKKIIRKETAVLAFPAVKTDLKSESEISFPTGPAVLVLTLYLKVLITETAVTSQTRGCGGTTGNDTLSRMFNMINAPKLPI